MKKAILFGASGFIGSYLLTELLNNADYDQITVVVRKNLDINHPKLKMLIGDFYSLPSLKENIVADDVFITLGTTKKSTPNQDEYYQIDHDYPVLAAKIAKQNGAQSVFLLTSVGANSNSTFFYIKTKGETERDITALDFDHTAIFRPSMLMGDRKENRPLEKIIQKVWACINPILIGQLNIYKGIQGKEVAKAMNNAAKNPDEKVKIYSWEGMHNLL
ncbi:MAG: NAD(P)H-binding protein [Gammaproteobacteria bacterium]|nr:NAD(P)H-binding protein [Gammaproteobacteria bacterium]